MYTRRRFALASVLGVAGCSQKELPLHEVEEEPPIESTYLFEQNALRVRHAGDEPLTHLGGHEIELVEIIAFPEEDNPYHGHGVPTVIEHGEESAKGAWVDHREHETGLVDPPLEPGDDVLVTWYAVGGTLEELHSGDRFEVVVRIDGERFGYSLQEIP